MGMMDHLLNDSNAKGSKKNKPYIPHHETQKSPLVSPEAFLRSRIIAP